MTVTLLPDRLFDGRKILENYAVTLRDDKIGSLQHYAGGEAQRLAGILVPGFVDVQVNGGGGVLFNAVPALQSIAAIGAAHVRFGTTSFLPTLVTDSVEVMEQAADAVAAALSAGVAGVCGIHFEGPHLSRSKKGVHAVTWIRPPSAAELAIFCRQDLGVRVITLAPEVVSVETIRRLVDSGARVCLGHSDADYATVLAALQAGACGFTHLYNAMSGLQSRAPGMVGAALDDSDSWCGLILDGYHVHPAAARVALAAKPRGKMMLVTDAMAFVGTAEISMPFFDSVIQRKGDCLTIATGELAGSTLDMMSAVRNAVRMLGVSLEEALRMASLYPAAFLGMDDVAGRIAPGQRANLVLLDEAALSVRACWLEGVRVV